MRVALCLVCALALACGSSVDRDRDGFARTSAELEATEAELAAAEEEWLALEILREEIDG